MGKKSAQSEKSSSNGASKSDGSHVLLPNGAKVPVAMPPGVDPAMAKQVIDYLKQNPQAAQQSYIEAQRILHTPGMAQSVLNSKTQTAADPAYQAKLQSLQSDPELKHVFDDIKSNGAAAMEKYWNDSELMSKISEKMGGVNLRSNGSSSNGKSAKVPAQSSQDIKSLHVAAQLGNVEAIERLLKEGQDVNQADGRGVTPLGLAVGYNKLPVVKVLLKAKADVHKADAKGSTALHYAAGYGRKEAAELLLEAGADPLAKNEADQIPADAARANREMHMVKFLKSRGGEQVTQGAKYL